MGKASARGWLGVWLLAAAVAVAVLVCPSLAWADDAPATPAPAVSSTPTAIQGGSSAQDAAAITPGAAYSDALGLGHERRWYKVALPKPGKFSLSFTGSFAESGTWTVSLRDASNGEIVTRLFQADTFYDGNPQKTRLCALTGLPAGTYYIEVTGLLAPVVESRSFSLATTFEPSTAWEAEPNDGPAQANDLAAGKSVSGTLLNSGDVDCYRIALPKAGKFTLTLAGPAANTGYWRVALQDANGAEVASRECRATDFISGKAQVCAVTGLRKGTYYVKVSGPLAVGGASAVENQEYCLATKLDTASSWEAELNDTPDTATALALGGSVSGTVRLGSASDDDWYRVNLSKAGTLALTFKGAYSGSGFWTAYLYKASDTSAAFASATYYATTKGAKRLATKSLKAGTYYVKVEGGAAVQNLTYTLSAKTLANLSSATVSSIAAKAYTGKAITPLPTLRLSGKTLKKGTDYTLTYQKNTKVGTASITITGKGNYTGTKKATFKIVKAANPMKASAVAKTVKASKAKKGPVELSGAIKVSGAKGSVTYAKVAQGSAKQLTVRKSNGKITVAKGTPKGTYKLKVKATAKGNSGYKAASKTVTVTVKVK